MFSENLERNEISDDTARVLDDLDDITNAISDLVEMDSDKFALALRDDNVAGWWKRGWRKFTGFFKRHGGTILKAATSILPAVLPLFG